MNREEFIKYKTKELKEKGFSKAQIQAVSNSQWMKGQTPQIAQQGTQFGQYNFNNQQVPQNIGYAPQNYGVQPTPYVKDYSQDFQQNNPLPWDNTVPQNIGYKPQTFMQYNKAINEQEVANTPEKQYNDITRYNVINPYGGIDLESSLTYAGQGFGEGNYGKAGLGTGLSLLKGARNFMTGYASGKESQRVKEEQYDELYNPRINYTPMQQGGSYAVTQNATPQQIAGMNINKNFAGLEVTPEFGTSGYFTTEEELNRRALQNAQQMGNQPYNPTQGFVDITRQGNTYTDNGSGVITGQPNYRVWKYRPEGYVGKKSPVQGVDYTDYNPTQYSEFQKSEVYRQRYPNEFPKSQGGSMASMQQGGKYELTNSDMLTGQYVTDQPLSNTTAEGGEYLQRARTGEVKEIVGAPHIQNGKEAEGVSLNLQNGDKILSDYTKIPPKNVKELKERYDLKLKKNATFADAQKAYDKKIGIQKTTEELSDYIEKFGENDAVQDPTTKRLNETALTKQIEQTKTKLDVLKDPQAMMFDDLFNIQESLPKKGQKGELLDKNGKAIEETAQQGKEMYQEGGMIDDIAKKYGISAERAQELLTMQEGGEQDPNAQQQGIDPQQIAQEVAQALQQGADPQQVLQQLLEMGLDQNQATQLIQGVMQQLQGVAQEQPQQEQIPVEGEQVVAQEGMKYAQEGKLQYDVATGKNTYMNSPREHQSAVENAAYGTPDPEIALQNLYNNFPDIISGEFKDNITIDKLGKVTFKKNLPLNKEQEIVRNFQKKADTRMRDSANTIINNPENFSPEKIESAKKYLSDETFVETPKDAKDMSEAIRGFDAKLGNFTSGRYSMGLNLLTPEDLKLAQESGIKTFKQLKNSPIYDKLSDTSKKRTAQLDKLIGKTDADYTLSEVQIPTTPLTEAVNNTGVNQGEEQRNITKNSLAMIPQNLTLPPSALSPLSKEQIALQRQEPLKQSIEPYLASQESNRQSDVARVQASGLSPSQQEALLASGLASSQLSANDAISKVEGFNAQNAYNADVFNIGQRAKEDITNANFNQQYEQKMLAGINNTERDWRNYYNESNAQNRQNYRDIEAINLLNAPRSEYNYVPGEGVIFLNNKGTDYGIGTDNFDYENATPAQVETHKKLITAKIDDKYGNLVKYKNSSNKLG